VHSTVIAYDLESDDGCIALSKHLDEQYERARQLLDRLVLHQGSRDLTLSTLIQLIESGQLERFVSSAPVDR
jgi:hypothetical protein